MAKDASIVQLIKDDITKLQKKIQSIENENYQLIEENIELKKQIANFKQNNPSLFTFGGDRDAEDSEKKESGVRKEEIELRIRQLNDCIDWLNNLK